MQRRIVILSILIFVTLSAYPQGDRGFRYYDSITYSRYLEGDWKELSKYSSEAIRHGHDYYYMRMRKAISLYERENYLAAISDFRRALEFNPGDPVALEYIYYCYLLSGKESNAMAVTASFTPSLKEKTGVDTDRMNRMSLAALYNNASSDGIIDNIEDVYGYGLPGNTLVTRYFIKTGLRASHYTGASAMLLHSANYMRKQNFLYYNDGINNLSLDNQNINQLQYYISLVLSSSKGWRLAPAFHLVNTGYPLVGISYFGARSQAYKYTVNDNSIIAGASLARTLGVFDLDMAAHYSGLNNERQLQARGGLKVSPLGNSKLYMGYGHYIVDNDAWRDGELQHISEIIAGFSVADAVWVDFTVLTGDMYNFHTANGLYVYNDVNSSDLSARLDISISLNSRGSFIFLGAGYDRNYTTYIPEGSLIPVTGDQYYNNILISGGLSWKF